MSNDDLATLPPIRLTAADLEHIAATAQGELNKRQLARECREDPALFIEHVYGRHLSALGTPRLAAHHHRWLDVLKDPDQKRVLIIAPRESWKSTIVTEGFMAWFIGNNPAETNLIASVSSSQSTHFAAVIGNTILSNTRWKDVFPEVEPDLERGWSTATGEMYCKRVDMEYLEWAERVALRKDPTLFTAGLRGRSTTGARVSGLAILDDPHDEENSYTTLAREKVNRWFKTTLLNLVTDDAKVIVILTRWHYADLASELMEQQGADDNLRWTTLFTPALDDEGKSYWPALWPVRRLEEKEAEVGSLIFACQYQQNPSGLRGRLLKEDWLLYVRHSLLDQELPCYYGIDFAVTEADVGLKTGGSRDPAYTSITRIRKMPDGPVIDAIFRTQQDFPLALRWIVRHAALDRPVRTVGEITGIGKAYLPMLGKAGLKIKGVHVGRAKAVRFQAMAAFFESGLVKVSDEVTPGLLAFKAEWVAFPSGAHDDTLASTEMAVQAAGINAGKGAQYHSKYAPTTPDPAPVRLYYNYT
jgi:phage terminase large subunit-like protein